MNGADINANDFPKFKNGSVVSSVEAFNPLMSTLSLLVYTPIHPNHIKIPTDLVFIL